MFAHSNVVGSSCLGLGTRASAPSLARSAGGLPARSTLKCHPLAESARGGDVLADMQLALPLRGGVRLCVGTRERGKCC